MHRICRSQRAPSIAPENVKLRRAISSAPSRRLLNGWRYDSWRNLRIDVWQAKALKDLNPFLGDVGHKVLDDTRLQLDVPTIKPVDRTMRLEQGDSIVAKLKTERVFLFGFVDGALHC